MLTGNPRHFRPETAKMVGAAEPGTTRIGPAIRAALGVVLLLASLGQTAATAGSVDAVVKDGRGNPVADAVVYASAPGKGAPSPPRARAVIDQQDKEFVPSVKPILLGTEVMFPNKDNIRHHVYSFSPAKKFELPLYKGTPAAPVTFDRAGVVVLGCNIHDWMLGFVYVIETPYFGTTGADGKAELRDLPGATYDVGLWHPRLQTEAAEALRQRVVVDGPTAVVQFTVSLKPDWRPRRVPSGTRDRYR